MVDARQAAIDFLMGRTTDRAAALASVQAVPVVNTQNTAAAIAARNQAAEAYNRQITGMTAVSGPQNAVQGKSFTSTQYFQYRGWTISIDSGNAALGFPAESRISQSGAVGTFQEPTVGDTSGNIARAKIDAWIDKKLPELNQANQARIDYEKNFKPSATIQAAMNAANPSLLSGITSGLGAIGSGITSGLGSFQNMLFKPRTAEELAQYDSLTNTPMIGLNIKGGTGMSQLDDIRSALSGSSVGNMLNGITGGGAAGGKPRGKNIVVMPDGSVKKLVSPSSRIARRPRRGRSGAGTAAIRRLEMQIQQQNQQMMMMMLLAGRS